MRLICPNCAAQYEVDTSMIPAEGRDVQCSSCGHTWFQRPDDADEMLADEAGVTEHDSSFDPVAPEAEAEAAKPPVAEAPKARPMDEAAREILRQEAAREAAARRREGGVGLESQPDLGLDDPAGAQSRAAAARARLARLRQSPEEATEGQAAAAAAEAAETQDDMARAVGATVSGSRRELLPDIEEINSTLTATGARANGDAVEDPVEDEKARRGFRLGFVSVLALVVALLLLYLFAPQISVAFPAATPALAGYLDWANGMLDQLDNVLRRAVDAMSGLVGTTE